MKRSPLDLEAPYEEVAAALLASEKAITEVCFQHLSGLSVTCAWFYGMGIGRRALALSSGYRTMVDQRNSLCALPIVRMQLDTALRLYAGFFVQDPLDFSEKVFNGAQINKVRSDDGAVMTDTYLLKRVAATNPWMPEVYKTTSGYIHFSKKHIMEIFKDGKSEKEFSVVIGPTDAGREPADYHESSRCLLHLNLIIECALRDWFERMRGTTPSKR